MANWYQGKIRYEKINDRGKNVKITEEYLVDAVSFTDAEARIYQKIAENIPDFKLSGLSKRNIHDVFLVESEYETWYKVKVQFISFDEKTQKEKLTPFVMLINAENIESAHQLIIDRLGNLTDFLITDINKTNILEIIHTSLEEEEKS